MSRTIVFFVICLLTVGISGQDAPAAFDLANHGVRIEPDKRLIVVLATLEMANSRTSAGVDTKVISTPLSDKSAEFRAELLKDNANLDPELRRRISLFVSQYKKSHPKASDSEIIAPFISMAFTLTPAPELGDPVITNDLPGSVLDVLDFSPLVREFYRRSPSSAKLDDYLKMYREDADKVLRPSAREMVSDLLDYLHTRPKLIFTEKIVTQTQKGKSKSTSLQQIETREHDRRFFIIPEKLAPKNNVNFLNVRDDYYVIVSPDTDLSFSEVRRAFLQFVIDPLILGNSKELAAVRDWVKPLLDERRKTNPDVTADVFLAVSRSLVAAVDTRQLEHQRFRIATEQAREKITGLETIEQKKALSAELEKYRQALSDEAALRLYEDYEKGAVLSFYFAEQLKGIEDSGFDIAGSLREMIASFDPVKETARIADSAEIRKRALAAREARKANPGTSAFLDENPVTKRLLEIQKVINAKDYTKAGAELQQLLTQNPKEPRIHFNIGRLASIQAVAIDDPELQARKLAEAKTAYSNVIRNATPTTDKALLSLTFVALGRIYEFSDDNAYATKLYDEAIKLGNIRGGGFTEAMDAKARLIKPQ